MSKSVPKVLVVDDGKEITDLIYSYSMYYKREFSTIVTNYPTDVIGILEENEDIRIIVTDFRMPSMNGLELFFKVREKHPHVQFIMMTGFGTPELRRKAEGGGFVRYLEKPFRIIELIKEIRRILDRQSKGFEGFVPSLELPDIIQLLALSKGDATLEISTSTHKGHIYFRSGDMVHAECEDYSGVEAFQKMFMWQSGKFLVNDLIPGVKRTIMESWQGLLLDAARIKDEAAADAESSEEKSTDTNDGEPVRTIEDEIIFDVLPDNEDSSSGTDLDSLEVEQPTEIEAPLDLQPSIGDLSLSEVEEAMEICTEFYRAQFPSDQEKVTISELPIISMHPLLRKYMAFHFHWVTTSAFRIEDTPFNLNNEKVAKAAYELLHVLLKTWEMSSDEFADMVRNAVRFHLARSIHPTAALSEFMMTLTDGRVGRLRQLLPSMISQGIIEKRVEPIFNQIIEVTEEVVTQDYLENIINSGFGEYSKADIKAELIESSDRLLELTSITKDEPNKTLQQEIVRAMLETRNLTSLIDALISTHTEDNSAVSIEELTELIGASSI